MSRRTRLALFFSVGLLTACATPQYQTSVRLLPPADAAGRACVQGCEATKTLCQSQCQSRYQACVSTLGPEVEAAYVRALGQYESQLKDYAAALRHSVLQAELGWLHRQHYGYPFGWDGYWNPWPMPYFPPPPEPVMPTREAVQSQVETERCQADCGCLPAYDGCFVGCGGQRISETLCIAHCPSPP